MKSRVPGTIKRQWGFSYILSKEGINLASTDVGFMFIAYNLRRKIDRFRTSVFQKILYQGQIQTSLKSI